MIIHQVFASIMGDEVKNIFVCDNYELANQVTRLTYGAEAYADECTQYPVSTGDKYINKQFIFKDGVTPVPRRNTAEEDAHEALEKLRIYQEQQTVVEVENDYRLSKLELGLN